MLSSIRFFGQASLALTLGLPASPATHAAELQPQTVEAFEQRVAAVENRPDERDKERTLFAWTAADDELRKLLRGGEIVVNPRQGKGDTAVEKGLIHHWIGAVFVPDRSASDALALLQNFDTYQQVYASVEDSKTLDRGGDAHRAYLRLRTHRIVTVVLNTEYQVEFVSLDERRWHSRSLSTRIAQVKDPGQPDESEMPVGNDSGFLWRIATFWRVEEADGGVYMQCEVIGLTRGVPYGLGWLIRPIIRSFPRTALSETLRETREALLENNRDTRPGRNLPRVSLAGMASSRESETAGR